MGKVMTLREYWEEVKQRECDKGNSIMEHSLEMLLYQKCGIGLSAKIELVNADAGEKAIGECDHVISWEDADSELSWWDTQGEESIPICHFHCEDTSTGPYARAEIMQDMISGSSLVSECFCPYDENGQQWDGIGWEVWTKA